MDGAVRTSCSRVGRAVQTRRSLGVCSGTLSAGCAEWAANIAAPDALHCTASELRPPHVHARPCKHTHAEHKYDHRHNNRMVRLLPVRLALTQHAAALL